MRMEIEDTAYQKSMLTVTITTPKEGMEYDEGVVRRSAKQLVDELSEHTSTGFTHALEDALRKRHESMCGMVVE